MEFGKAVCMYVWTYTYSIIFCRKLLPFLKFSLLMTGKMRYNVIFVILVFLVADLSLAAVSQLTINFWPPLQLTTLQRYGN